MEKLKKILFCHILNWHRVIKTGTDGASEVGRCKHCDRICLKDSQGNWFLRDGRTKWESVIDFITVLIIFLIIALIIKGVN